MQQLTRSAFNVHPYKLYKHFSIIAQLDLAFAPNVLSFYGTAYLLIVLYKFYLCVCIQEFLENC